jgi:hypothetical protein
MHTAYYAFLKQAKLWEMHYALPQPDPEAERAASAGHEPILSFEAGRAQAADGERKRERRAA